MHRAFAHNSASTTATHQAGGGQGPHHLPLAVAVAVLVVGAFSALKGFFSFLLAPLAPQVRQKHATAATLTQHAARDQKLHEGAIIIAFAVFRLQVLASLFRVIEVLTYNMSEEQPPATTAEKQSARYQCPHEAAIVRAFGACLVGVLVVLFDVSALLAALAQ